MAELQGKGNFAQSSERFDKVNHQIAPQSGYLITHDDLAFFPRLHSSKLDHHILSQLTSSRLFTPCSTRYEIAPKKRNSANRSIRYYGEKPRERLYCRSDVRSFILPPDCLV